VFDGSDDGELGFVALTLCELCDFALNLRDDGFGLGEPVQMICHLE
jgi:hypothetical protein